MDDSIKIMIVCAIIALLATTICFLARSLYIHIRQGCRQEVSNVSSVTTQSQSTRIASIPNNTTSERSTGSPGSVDSDADIVFRLKSPGASAVVAAAAAAGNSYLLTCLSAAWICSC